MTKLEENLINNYQDYLQSNSYRFHDAVIIPLWEAELEVIPLQFNQYELKASFYNNNQPYEGRTTTDEITHHSFLNQKDLTS